MSERLKGIDVSVHQGTVDFKRVRAAGYGFAVAKATEGLTYDDPTFARNWKAIAAAGLVRGAYHFARPQPGRTGRGEAEHFLRIVEKAGLRRDDLLVLDIEVSTGLGREELEAFVESFVDEVVARAGRRPVIYTGHWWRDHGLRYSRGCPLWLAAYVSDPDPYVPAAWKTWTIWQHTDRASVPGVSGGVDADLYKGTAGQLRDLGDTRSAAIARWRKAIKVKRGRLDKVRARARRIRERIQGLREKIRDEDARKMGGGR